MKYLDLKENTSCERKIELLSEYEFV